MRIAQVSPLYESVPPKLYGGTERVVHYLTEELVAQGHEVTLFASGDSRTSARLVAPCEEALRLNNSTDQMAHHVLMLEWVRQMAHQFDIIHYHVDYIHYPISRRMRTPSLTTVHGRLDIPELKPLYAEFGDMPLVSISYSQREPLERINWQGTVYHGLPAGLHKFHEGPGEYLAFIGRISPEKQVDHAIAIAKAVGMKLKIAAKIDKGDREYFERDIRPLFDDPLVEYIGEIGEDAKCDFLGGAVALLFPLNWEEPFGMVMIESLACGTPVVAYRRGSVPEVMQEGISGFVVDTLEEAIEATRRVVELDRRRCWELFRSFYTAERMADDYVTIYQRLAANSVRSWEHEQTA